MHAGLYSANLFSSISRVDRRLWLVKQVRVVQRYRAFLSEPRPEADQQETDGMRKRGSRRQRIDKAPQGYSRNGNECYCAKADNRIAPSDTEVLEHWVNGYWHACTEKCSDKVI